MWRWTGRTLWWWTLSIVLRSLKRCGLWCATTRCGRGRGPQAIRHELGHERARHRERLERSARRHRDEQRPIGQGLERCHSEVLPARAADICPGTPQGRAEFARRRLAEELDGCGRWDADAPEVGDGPVGLDAEHEEAGV